MLNQQFSKDPHLSRRMCAGRTDNENPRLGKREPGHHRDERTGGEVMVDQKVRQVRDAQTGLWARFKPEELATPRAFLKNPRLVWEWYDWRRKLVASARPNPAHLALVEMEKRVPRLTLITQNVDGLHQRAGSGNVVELHGNIQRTKCFTENTVVTEWPDTADVPPKCPRCGGLLRPDVVWFEEAMPEVETELAFRVSRECDVFFSIGTSTMVHPAAALPGPSASAIAHRH